MADDIDRDVNVATRANAESAWTFGTMFLHFNNRLDGIETRTAESRHEMDRRYEQRWEAQETAITSALDTTEKVVVAAVMTAKSSVEDADRRYEQRWAAQQEAVKAALFLQEKALESAVSFSAVRHTESDLRYEQRWEAEERAIANAVIASNEILADRDKRYEQRWSAQEHAISAALASQEKAVTAAMVSAKEAVLKAEIANEKRFDTVNEFRGTLSDQASKLMPRIEVDARLNAMSEKMSDMSARMDRSDGRGSGMSMLWGIMVAGFGVIGVLVTISMLLFHAH